MLLVVLLLAGCSGTSERDSRPLGEAAYDGYPETADVPPDLALIPEPVPRDEPLSRYGNPPEYEVFGQRYRTLASSEGFEEEGVASWYGTRFHGRRTSSGETYDMYAMTAAHKSLPLPSYVRVTNLENGKQVVVRVNDRGPFVDGRIIDLSYAAAHRIDMTDVGVARVHIRAVGPGDVGAGRVARSVPEPEPLPAAESAAAADGPEHAGDHDPVLGESEHGVRYVQVGAFAERRAAERVQADLVTLGLDAVRISTLERADGAELHRVRIGPLPDSAAVQAITDQLEDTAHGDYRIVDVGREGGAD
nr:septal ring lytic transglycosylase RlpA family protein [Thioalkalivibrio sp. ALJT]